MGALKPGRIHCVVRANVPESMLMVGISQQDGIYACIQASISVVA